MGASGIQALGGEVPLSVTQASKEEMYLAGPQEAGTQGRRSCLAGAGALEACRIGPSRPGAGTFMERGRRVALGVPLEAGDWNQLLHL